jgi:hypothetical protein
MYNTNIKTINKIHCLSEVKNKGIIKKLFKLLKNILIKIFYFFIKIHWPIKL